MDYEVKDKLFLEKILDVEFQDANITDKAVFYSGISEIKCLSQVCRSKI